MKSTKEFVSIIYSASTRWLLVVGVFLLGLIIFTPFATYLYFANDLTTKEAVMNRNETGVTLLDRNNKPFFTFYDAHHKTFIPLSAIPTHTKEAVIAAEDKRFYTHPGFSFRSITAAFIANLKQGDRVYGGSTITQQLVKNSLLRPRKNFFRKYQELVLAFEIERKFSKDEILEMYFNSAYFGSGYFGIGTAAEGYFGKKVSDLTISESSILAALLPSPSKLSPFTSEGEQLNDRLKQRQTFVLSQMVDEGFITQNEAEEVEKEKINLRSVKPPMNIRAPHFAIMVRDELIDKFGEEKISRSGFKVKTTLDLAFQEYAEQIVSQQVERLARNGVTNGAAVVLSPKTGEILALVGSTDWHNQEFGKVNVVLSNRQPGSAFKPIVYATAFEQNNITPSTILRDRQTTYKVDQQDYTPRNYDGVFRGDVLPRRALANSLNVPSVEVISKVGVPKVVESAKRFGLTTLQNPHDYGLSLVLGAGEVKLLELTNAYAVFANKGVLNKPVTILEITDKQGDLLEQYDPEQNGIKVLDEKYAFLISSILSDSRARWEVFGNTLTISRPAAVKTGTTQNFKDAWTLGFTPSFAVGVWVGNNDGRPMDSIAGSLGAAPIWKSLMEEFLRGRPIETFTPPEGIVRTPICMHNGLLLRSTEATTGAYIEYFVQGFLPTGFCEIKIEETKEEEEKKEDEAKQEEQENKEGPSENPRKNDKQENKKTD